MQSRSAPALADEALQPEVDERPIAREGLAGAQRDAELSGRSGAGAERQLAATHAEPERRRTGPDLGSGRPARGVEAARVGPGAPHRGAGDARARARRPAERRAQRGREVRAVSLGVAEPRPQAVVGARVADDTHAADGIERHAPRKPEPVVAHYGGLRRPPQGGVVVEPPGGASGPT